MIIISRCCIKSAGHPNKATCGLPSLPAEVSVKVEADTPQYEDGQQPCEKKPKLDSDYDDWLDDIIYTRISKSQDSLAKSIDCELEKYDAEPQWRGDLLEW